MTVNITDPTDTGSDLDNSHIQRNSTNRFSLLGILPARSIELERLPADAPGTRIDDFRQASSHLSDVHEFLSFNICDDELGT